jgi:hypothetical protein
MFLNTAYSELIYQLVAMSVSLEVAARAGAEPEPTAALEKPKGPEEPWWRRPAPALGGAARVTRMERA